MSATSLIYRENVKTRSRINFSEADANDYYLKHYRFALMLRATERNAIKMKDFKLSARCRVEIEINERKLTFWERHKNFQMNSVMIEQIARAKHCNYDQITLSLD